MGSGASLLVSNADAADLRDFSASLSDDARQKIMDALEAAGSGSGGTEDIHDTSRVCYAYRKSGFYEAGLNRDAGFYEEGDIYIAGDEWHDCTRSVDKHFSFTGGQVKVGGAVKYWKQVFLSRSFTLDMGKCDILAKSEDWEDSFLLEGKVVSIIGSVVSINFERGVAARTLQTDSTYGGFYNNDVDPWRILSAESLHFFSHTEMDFNQFTEAGPTPDVHNSDYAIHNSDYVSYNYAAQLLGKLDKFSNLLRDKTFYCLSAERLRQHSGPLPHFQDLIGSGGWLSEHTISIDGVIKGKYTNKYCAVSHRWLQHNNPFNENKLRMLVSFLADHPDIEYVWLDWACLPQQIWSDDRSEVVVERTTNETNLFKDTLPFINMLYLGMSVVRLIDAPYMERFWTLFELFLSFQHVAKHGLEESKSRCFHNVLLEPLQDIDEQTKLWSTSTVEACMLNLSSDKVQVTNKSDKDVCLEKLHDLNMATSVIFNTLSPPEVFKSKDPKYPDDTCRAELA
jgi:hypothetical protein